MKVLALVALLVACLVLETVNGQAAAKEPKVGKPQFSLQGGGGGKNLRNFNAGFNAGANTRVWQSQNKRGSLDLNANYGRSYMRHQGQTFKSKPDKGVGATFKWRF